MHPNVSQVVAAAAESGLTLEPVTFAESTRTAAEAAAAVGVAPAQIVKSLVFGVTGSESAVVMALVNGASLCDTAKLADAAGVAEVHRVDANAVRAATGYPIGGVPPFGHATEIPVFVDEILCRFDTVWAAAGTPHVNFAIAPADLVTLTGGVVCDLRAVD